MSRPFLALVVLLSILPMTVAVPVGAQTPPAVPTVAGDLEAGRQALAAGDYATALQRLQPLAEQGDGEAALLLGRMADNGWGMPESAAAAWGWYKRAADHGQVEGMLRAADGLDWGRGATVDHAQAYALYQRAAQTGNARARGRLGEMALHGRGRKIDLTTAVAWLRDAARADDAEALALLDDLAERGLAPAMPGGTTVPAEPQARRVLAEVRQAIAGMPELRLDGETSVLSRADGSLLVTVPDLSWTAGGLEARLGTVRVVVRDIEGDDAHVELLLPSRVVVTTAGVPAAVLSLANPSLGGAWSFGRHRFRDLAGSAVAASLDIRRAMRLSLRDVSFDTHFDEAGGRRPAAREQASAADASLQLALGTEHLRAAAERLSWHGDAGGLGAAANWPLPAARLLLSGGPSATLDGTVTADQASFGRAGQPRLSAGRLEAAADIAELRPGLVTARFRYSHDGLDDRLAPTLLVRLAAEVSARNWPVAAVGDAAAAVAERLIQLSTLPGAGRNAAPVGLAAVFDMPMASLVQALGKAGTDLRLNQASAGGPGWSATAAGQGAPTVDGIAWVADADIDGLDRLLALPQVLDQGAGVALKRAAKPATDAAGHQISRVRLFFDGAGIALGDGQRLTLGGW